jgi:opacity protein-like surface antigen
MRKETYVTIDTEGRDQGKVYKLTEMPASQAEAWATRLMLALARGGVDLPSNFLDLGMEGIAVVGIRALAGMTWGDARPLLDEMMTCIRMVPDPQRPQVVRELVETDIEEIGTRLRLRDEVIALHTNFSLRERLSTSTGTASGTPTNGNGALPTIATSAAA